MTAHAPIPTPVANYRTYFGILKIIFKGYMQPVGE
jgi:hypothetical protein